MARPRVRDPLNPRQFFQELVEALKSLGYKRALEVVNAPLIGREAIIDWLWTYGLRRRDGSRITWDTVLEWQRRTGEPFMFHGNARGRHTAPPVTTPLLMLRWCMIQTPKLGVPGSLGWSPGPRAVRNRRLQERLQTNP